MTNILYFFFDDVLISRWYRQNLFLLFLLLLNTFFVVECEKKKLKCLLKEFFYLHSCFTGAIFFYELFIFCRWRKFLVIQFYYFLWMRLLNRNHVIWIKLNWHERHNWTVFEVFHRNWEFAKLKLLKLRRTHWICHFNIKTTNISNTI